MKRTILAGRVFSERPSAGSRRTRPTAWLLAALVASVVMLSGFGRTVFAQTASAPKQAVVETTAGTFIIDLAP